MKKILLVVLFFDCLIAAAQNNINIFPMPAELKMSKGSFIIDKNTHIVLEGSRLEKIAEMLNIQIKKSLGHELKITNKYVPNSISLNYERLDNALRGAYTFTIDAKGIYIAGDNEEGVFYGVQTLIQLLSQTQNSRSQVPYLTITDYPRFAYRGMHLDVGRHFFPVSYIKKYIDYLAAYKFNTFHWHLTEDQGWRIEIKKYPELTKIGAWRNGTIVGRYPGKGSDNTPYGGFYTQEEIKEVVQYAAARYIDVIPEIEMPGHSSAAIAAYPWLSCFPAKPTAIPAKMISQKSIHEQKNGRIKLVQETWGVFDDVFCAGKDSTFMFLENVIDEVLPLFPSKYFHIGGDESPKTHWKICPACQKRIKDLGLKDEHELQSYFVQRIEKYLNSKGKTLIGWDEILEGGLAPNATVMSWRGEKGGIAAAKEKHYVVMTPETPLYLNWAQSRTEDSITQGGFNSVEAVYNYDPIPKELNEEQGKYILGAQGNLWSEYISNPLKVEYMLFPRMIALSEVLWSPKEKRNWNDFEKKLPVIFDRLDEQNINYSRAYYGLKATVMPTDDLNGVMWKLESNSGRSIKYIDRSNERITVYQKPILVKESTNITSVLVDNNKELARITQSFRFNKATGKKIMLVNPPHKNYPGDGAFTLVNGVQNERGMLRSSEFLGFLGTDLDATIDLGKETEIKEVRVHTFTQTASWIYPPQQGIKVMISTDGINYTTPEDEVTSILPDDGVNRINFSLDKKIITARYIRVVAKNYGIIPSGQPGGGSPAWLFVDEIEVD